MIQVILKTDSLRKTINVDKSTTPAEAFAQIGVNTAGGMPTLNGTVLSVSDMGSSFESLGVAEGTSCNLNNIVKAQGAK